MAKAARYKQAEIRLAADELAAGREVFALDDVLYAEVVDRRGRQVEGWLRGEDVAPIFALAGLIALVAVAATLISNAEFRMLVDNPQGPNRLLGLAGAIMMWWTARALVRSIRRTGKARRAKPLSVRIYLRERSVEVVQIGSLLRGQFLVARINGAASRRMLGGSWKQ
jgi:hypothetical protein